MKFLDLPRDILNAIPKVALDNEAIRIKRKLATTCKTLYQFFQADLDKSEPQLLLSYVLQGNVREAKKMYEANPRLLFIDDVTAEEYAAGIDDDGRPVYRTQVESPFKAAARAGDVLMLKDMQKQFHRVFDKTSKKSGGELAKEQLAEAFPNGFEYPRSTYDFSELVEATSKDQVLMNANDFVKPREASPATEKALAKFRQDFMPGSEKVGFHFNLNELIKAFRVYNSKLGGWNDYQAGVFWCQVVGYLERLVSACDAQVLCQDISKVLDGATFLERGFDLDLYINHQHKKISYFPLGVDPSCALGEHFAVDNNVGWRWGADHGVKRRFSGLLVVQAFIEKLCQLKTARLEEFKRQLHKSVDQPEVSQDVQQGLKR